MSDEQICAWVEKKIFIIYIYGEKIEPTVLSVEKMTNICYDDNEGNGWDDDLWG